MRGSKILSWVVLGALALGIVLGLGLVAYRQGVSAQEGAQQQAEIVALQAGMDEANTRLEALGETPVPVPSAQPGDDPIVPVAVGPTDAQMDAALDRYCATRDCTPGPTRAQVAEALADLCSEVRCRGADGKDSTVPGPGPTDAQMNAAQARYCDTHDGCVGPAGADGRGLLSMQCATGGWVIKYTDLSTEPDPGPCVGPQGVHGEQGAQGIQGEQGTAKPGTYTCPDGEVMTGFSVADDGAVTLACEDTTPPIVTPTP